MRGHRGDYGQEVPSVRGICDAHGGHGTAEVWDVRRTGVSWTPHFLSSMPSGRISFDGTNDTSLGSGTVNVRQLLRGISNPANG